MKRRRQKLKYRKERVLLSDVLPYEIPVTFSNRNLYRFVVKNQIEINNGILSWVDSGSSVEATVKLLCGIPQEKKPNKAIETRFDRQVPICRIKLKKADLVSIPFSFRIRHKRGAYRELAICHPRNQIQVASFYHSFKELILYYCSIGKFSIRRPYKVSRFTFHKDKTHYDSLTEDVISIEEFDKEYENLRSFFVYKDYSNIYKFYESYRFFRAEKKYERMAKLDISKCFDSIYTHSLAWALLDKSIVKRNLGSPDVNKTLGHAFDSLMQCINYNETNGIIIGPEFSRIFAELILQSVDRRTEAMLRERHKLQHKRDYEVFRYVDDFFIFYNEESDKERIVDEIQIGLKEHKLYLNNEKQENFEKPIITPISIAKNQIAKLFDDRLCYKISKTERQEGAEVVVEYHGTIKIHAKSLKTEFRSILRQSGIEYKDILNFSLAVIERRLLRILRDYKAISKNPSSEEELANALTNLIDFTSFIYTVAPRVNTTIKLCRIVRQCAAFYRRKGVNRELRNTVFKQIYDDILFVIRKNRLDENTQVETLYLLLALVELGRDYWLREQEVRNYFGIHQAHMRGEKELPLNYFGLSVLMFYIKDKERYANLRDLVEREIESRLTGAQDDLQRRAENTLLLFDSLSCPYISNSTKSAILQFNGIKSPVLRTEVIESQDNWFTTWRGFDLGHELAAKHSQEVY